MSGSHSPNNKEVPEIYDAGYGGLHLDNLFDQDETVAGDLIDPATGEAYDNSTSTDRQLFEEGERQTGYIFDPEEDAPADEIMDHAAAWLSEHDVPRAATDPAVNPDDEPPRTDSSQHDKSLAP